MNNFQQQRLTQGRIKSGFCPTLHHRAIVTCASSEDHQNLYTK